MIEVELQVPEGVETEAVVRVVEGVCRSQGLRCTPKATLLRYPGSIHWHLKQGKQKGTLEITWWPKKHRLWFKVATNRQNQWIHNSVSTLKESMERALLPSIP